MGSLADVERWAWLQELESIRQECIAQERERVDQHDRLSDADKTILAFQAWLIVQGCKSNLRRGNKVCRLEWPCFPEEVRYEDVLETTKC